MKPIPGTPGNFTSWFGNNRNSNYSFSPGIISPVIQELLQEPVPRDDLQELWEFSSEFPDGFPRNSSGYFYEFLRK